VRFDSLAQPVQCGLLRGVEIESEGRWPRLAARDGEGCGFFDNLNQAAAYQRAEGRAWDFEPLQRLY
jgi:hypothetical protein